MSKFSKLVRNPDMFFRDAIIKRTKSGQSVMPLPIKKSQTKNGVTKIELYETARDLKKINLVIIDDINHNTSIKNSIIKYQLRSIKKYTNFDSISYISKTLTSTSDDVKVFNNYDAFYHKVISSISPAREFFIFVNLNFIFLKKTSYDSFIDASQNPLTFIKGQKKKDGKEKDIINKIAPYFTYKFSPIENYCCTDNITLSHYYKVRRMIDSDSEYIFDLLPILNVLHTSKKSVAYSPIQFSNLSGNYEDKLVWVLGVHGSQKCPVGITFKRMTPDTDNYIQFLDQIVPHSERDESIIHPIANNRISSFPRKYTRRNNHA